METYFIEMLGALFGAASGAIVWLGIIITVLWVIMPIFVVMMNSKLKKMNANLAILAEVASIVKRVGIPITGIKADDEIIDVAIYDTDGKQIGFEKVGDKRTSDEVVDRCVDAQGIGKFQRTQQSDG